MSQCARRRRASRVSSPPLPSPETCRSRSGYPGRPVFRRREFTLSRLFPPIFQCSRGSRAPLLLVRSTGLPRASAPPGTPPPTTLSRRPRSAAGRPTSAGPSRPRLQPTPQRTGPVSQAFFRARSPLFVKETSFTFRSRDSDRRDRLVSCDADSDRLRRRFRAGSALFAAGAQVSLQVPTNKLYRSWYDGAYGYVSAEPIVSIDKVYCEAGENERVRERQSGKE